VTAVHPVAAGGDVPPELPADAATIPATASIMPIRSCRDGHRPARSCGVEFL